MGLDTVEMLLAVEEYFDIEIPNDAAAKMNTVGALHEYLYSELRQRGDSRSAIQIFDELRVLVAAQAGVNVEQVLPDSSFVYDLRMD